MKDYLIKDVKIEHFRGLSDISLLGCKRINLVMGKNNAGKTSVLEAISLIKNENIDNLLKTASYRNSGVPLTDRLYYLYSRNSKKISVSFETSVEPVKVESKIHRTNIIWNRALYSNVKKNVLFEIRARQFEGKEVQQTEVEYSYNGSTNHSAFSMVDLYLNNIKATHDKFPVVYVGPADHFSLEKHNISSILKNERYYNAFLEVLKIFDDSIEDLKYLPSDDAFGSAELYVKTKGNELEPISTFGDGLKKAVILAFSVIAAKDGVLLLDEIETSLHFSCLEMIFAFLMQACANFNVQAFITTHSDETINRLLDINHEGNDDEINLFTLMHKGHNIYVRKLSGAEAYKTRNMVGLEPRE